MKKRHALHLLICLIWFAVPTFARSGQPNIIIYMVDDLGWNHIGVEQGTMGSHGKQYVTPNLAQLAKEGLSFTHAYAQPNCAPTRAAMLSGQYPARIHNDVYVVGNLNRNGRGGISKEEAKFTGPKQSEDVAPEAVTIAEALKQPLGDDRQERLIQQSFETGALPTHSPASTRGSFCGWRSFRCR